MTSERRVRQLAVAVGHRNDRYAEVIAGLGDGDQVVLYPGDALRVGARVGPQQ